MHSLETHYKGLNYDIFLILRLFRYDFVVNVLQDLTNQHNCMNKCHGLFKLQSLYTSLFYIICLLLVTDNYTNLTRMNVITICVTSLYLYKPCNEHHPKL